MKKTFGKLALMAVTIASAAFMLAGCSGDDGSMGFPGKDGTNGTNGTNGINASSAPINVTSLTPEQFSALTPTGVVTGVTINSPPVVTFKVTGSNGNPIVGLGSTSKSSSALFPGYTNLAFSIAKLVPGSAGSPSKWVNYCVTTIPTVAVPTPTTGSRPSTDNVGTLVDNGDGTYQYTFYRDIKLVKDVVAGYTDSGNNRKADLGDLTYDPNLTHRVTIQISGNAPGTGSNTPNGVTVTPGVPMANPANIIYDFIPASNKAVTATDSDRDITLIAKCNQCHGKLAFHGGGRIDTKYCVVCHNDQRKYGRANVTSTADAYPALTKSGSSYTPTTEVADGAVSGDFPIMVHKIHMGTELTKKNYNYANVLFDKLGFSMLDVGIRNCRVCHVGDTADQLAAAPQANNWKNVPSRLSCGSCHDGINWATGKGTALGSSGIIVGGHIGGSATSDAKCAECHSADTIEVYHQTANPTVNNPSVPVGATNFTYDVSSAAVNATSNDLTIKFRILAVTPPATTAAPVTFVPAAATVSASLAGFTSNPAFLLAYAMGQDGIAAPADFNNLGKANAQPASIGINTLLSTNSAAVGSMAGPDASGYYTATIKSASAFPVGATMRTVALQGYYTQVSPAVPRHTISVVKTVGTDTVRRAVVDPAKCGSCHEWFEGHGGNRVIGAGSTGINLCTLCHVPNLSSSGRTATVPVTMAATEQVLLTASGYSITDPLGWPEDTNNLKDMIHGFHAGKDRAAPLTFVRLRSGGSYYFNAGPVNTGSVATSTLGIGFPNALKNCLACHLPGTFSSVPTAALVSTNVTSNGTNTTAGILAARASLPNANTDTITTPFTAACVTCHDSAAAQSHMISNGGKIKMPRSAANLVGESCAVCHGSGSTYDPATMHQ